MKMKSKRAADTKLKGCDGYVGFRTNTAALTMFLVVYMPIFKMFYTYSPAELFKFVSAPSSSKFEPDDVEPHTTATTGNIHSKNKSIRKWGCQRRETPTIFVHIGKAGGGEIRTRLAGAAEDYNRTKREWHKSTLDNHFYPIFMENDEDDEESGESKSFRRGKFCNSMNANSGMIPKNNRTTPLTNKAKSFEGDRFCNATTPFGMAIACPMGYRSHRQYHSTLCPGCNDEYYLESVYYKNASEEDKATAAAMVVNPPNPGHICDTVYVSHNNLGGELNWLPPRYLKEYWWDNSHWNSNHAVTEKLEKYWASLLSDRNHRTQEVLKLLNNTSLNRIYSENTKQGLVKENSQLWCPTGYNGISQNKGTEYHRPDISTPHWRTNQDRYEHCTRPIGEAADRVFREFWSDHPQKGSDRKNDAIGFSDDNDYSAVYASMPVHRITMLREPFSWLVSKFFWDKKVSLHNTCKDIFFSSIENPTMSWIELYSYQYLFYLCGYDCKTRFENKMISLEGIEAQAEGNLRNSFSVVGLLQESDSFYEMIHERIDYLDMNKTVDVEGQRHSSSHEEKPMCQILYSKNETFREHVRSSLPAFAAMERIYYVGVEVNRFQKEELAQCG